MSKTVLLRQVLYRYQNWQPTFSVWPMGDSAKYEFCKTLSMHAWAATQGRFICDACSFYKKCLKDKSKAFVNVYSTVQSMIAVQFSWSVLLKTILKTFRVFTLFTNCYKIKVCLHYQIKNEGILNTVITYYYFSQATAYHFNSSCCSLQRFCIIALLQFYLHCIH